MKLELPRGMRDLESDELFGINYIKEKAKQQGDAGGASAGGGS